METINQEQYMERLRVFVAEEKEKSVRKPSGFFGNWAFHAIKEAEFKRLLRRQGIMLE